MRKLFSFAAIVLSVMLIIVSCAPENVQSDNMDDTIQVFFGNLEAKAIDDTAYSVAGSASIEGGTVKVGNVDDYYWSYSATKNDSLFTEGQTDGFVNCVECANDGTGGTGLGTARTVSKGKWLFELRAYATAADRTAGTQHLFSGTNESITTNNSDTVLSSNTTISIPVEYSYIAGTGIADFAITTTLTQDKEEAGSDIKTYTVTGVTASIGGKDYPLTGNADKTLWTFTTPQEVPSGVQAVGLKVFVDSTEVSQASNASVGNAIILHGLTTEIKGTATITLTGSTIGLTFNPGMPSEQPTKDGFPVAPVIVTTTAPADTEIGDILSMGVYPATYTNSSGNSVSAGGYVGKPVTWQVLNVDKTNNKVLVISEKVLTTMAHMSQDDYSDYTWGKSLIRTWLNNTAPDGFMSQYCLSNVSIVEVSNKFKLKEFGYYGSTTDKVFLLSYDESISYKSYMLTTNLDEDAEDYWLRDQGYDTGDGRAVNRAWLMHVVKKDDGTLDGSSDDNVGWVANVQLGVRPAFWIEMESGGGGQ